VAAQVVIRLKLLLLEALAAAVTAVIAAELQVVHQYHPLVLDLQIQAAVAVAVLITVMMLMQ
jgi:hypothetical protein